MVLDEKKGGGKGFGLNRLFQRKQSEQHLEPVQNEETVSEQTEEEAKAAAELQECIRESYLTEVKDDLYKVWKFWSDKAMPDVCMLEGKSSQLLCGNLAALRRERLVLNVRLKQDSKRRLDELEKAHKRKLEAEERARREQEAAEQDGSVPGQDSSQPMTQEQMVEQILKQELEGAGSSALPPVCRVYLSHDRMFAWYIMFPPYNMVEGSADESYSKLLATALEEAGVTTGLHAEDLRRVMEEKPYMELICIAAGIPAVEGTDGDVIEHYERERKIEAAVDEQGNIDYHNTNFVCSIHVDDVICEIIPPVPGTPGMRLDGSEVPPKKVLPAKVFAGKNTKITEDGTKLVATKDGNLKFEGGRFCVADMLTLHGDVDYSTGNIDFMGDVHVIGGVRENFAVRATGNIRIDGLVEAAEIEAGGDLIIAQGVVGNGLAKLRCGGNIQAKYLESVEAHAGKNVMAECIINSQIYCDDSVVVNTGRGVIVGGTITATNLIKAKVIGTQADRLTELVLGECSYIEPELERLTEELDATKAEHHDLDHRLRQVIKRLEMMGGDMSENINNNPALAQAREHKDTLEAKTHELEKQIEELEAKRPDIFKCRLECGIIYPITTLKLHMAFWSAEDEKKNCVVMYDKEERLLKEKYGCMSYSK